jgi:hypothetical protein
MGRRTYTFDADQLLKDAGAISASAAAQVAAADKILDMGAARFEGVVVIDVTAVEIASNDEEYDVIVQGSNSSSFASGIENLGQLNMGATEVRQGAAQDSATGRYELLFTNEQDGTVYRYIRLYTVVGGSIGSGGINYTAFLSTLPGR